MPLYDRGTVVKGPDLLGGHSFRPYVCLTDSSHPFSTEEGLFAAATTTPRDVAIQLTEDDFEAGGLPRETYINPWTVVTIKHADFSDVEARLTPDTTDRIATASASYLGVDVDVDR